MPAHKGDCSSSLSTIQTRQSPFLQCFAGLPTPPCQRSNATVPGFQPYRGGVSTLPEKRRNDNLAGRHTDDTDGTDLHSFYFFAMYLWSSRRIIKLHTIIIYETHYQPDIPGLHPILCKLPDEQERASLAGGLPPRASGHYHRAGQPAERLGGLRQREHARGLLGAERPYRGTPPRPSTCVCTGAR